MKESGGTRKRTRKLDTHPVLPVIERRTASAKVSFRYMGDLYGHLRSTSDSGLDAYTSKGGVDEPLGHTYIQIHTHIPTHVHTHTHTHTHTQTYTHTHTETNTHTY